MARMVPILQSLAKTISPVKPSPNLKGINAKPRNCRNTIPTLSMRRSFKTVSAHFLFVSAMVPSTYAHFPGFL